MLFVAKVHWVFWTHALEHAVGPEGPVVRSWPVYAVVAIEAKVERFPDGFRRMMLVTLPTGVPMFVGLYSMQFGESPGVGVKTTKPQSMTLQ